MKVAHITPAKYILEFDRPGAIHLCLAHLILEKSTYAEAFKTLSSRNRFNENENGGMVILDNGAFELDHAIPDDFLIEAAIKIHPQEIVLPDVRRDARSTLERSEAFIARAKRTHGLGYEHTYMAVPQGTHYAEWRQNLLDLSAIPDISTFGIYEETEKWFPDGRIGLLKELATGVPQLWEAGKKVHLLGFSEGLKDMFYAASVPWVRSTDSGKMIVWAAHGIGYNRLVEQGGPPPYPGRPKGYFDAVFTMEQLECAFGSVKTLDRWMEQHSVCN
jgi:hypothetical protein